MVSSEACYPTTAHPEQSNIADAQENDVKTNFVKMIEVLQKEMNKPLKEIQKNTNKQQYEINKLLKNARNAKNQKGEKN